MKMAKKIIFGLAVAVVLFAGFSVSAMTEAERQDLILSLIRQISALQAQLKALISSQSITAIKSPARQAKPVPKSTITPSQQQPSKPAESIQDDYNRVSEADKNSEKICKPNWLIGSWQPCVNKQQKRTVKDLNNCVNYNAADMPSMSQSCFTTEDIACQERNLWAIGEWSVCVNNRQTRKVIDFPTICKNKPSRPAESQECCSPDWQLSDKWSQCTNGKKTKSYVDAKNCPIPYSKPNAISENCCDPLHSAGGCWWISELGVAGPVEELKGKIVNSIFLKLDQNSGLAIWQKDERSDHIAIGLTIYYSFYKPESGWSDPKIFRIPSDKGVDFIKLFSLKSGKPMLIWKEYNSRYTNKAEVSYFSSIFEAPDKWSSIDTLFSKQAIVKTYLPGNDSVLLLFYEDQDVPVPHDDRYQCAGGNKNDYTDHYYDRKISYRLYSEESGWTDVSLVAQRSWYNLGKIARNCGTVYSKWAELQNTPLQKNMYSVDFSGNAASPSFKWMEDSVEIADKKINLLEKKEYTEQYVLGQGWAETVKKCNLWVTGCSDNP